MHRNLKVRLFKSILAEVHYRDPSSAKVYLLRNGDNKGHKMQWVSSTACSSLLRSQIIMNAMRTQVSTPFITFFLPHQGFQQTYSFMDSIWPQIQCDQSSHVLCAIQTAWDLCWAWRQRHQNWGKLLCLDATHHGPSFLVRRSLGYHLLRLLFW